MNGFHSYVGVRYVYPFNPTYRFIIKLATHNR